MPRRIVTSLLILATSAACFAQTVPSSSHASAQIAQGKHLFITDGCSECHGTSAEGGTGPHLAPNPLPFAAFRAYLRNPAGEMPPYAASVLRDADIAKIYAYLEAVPMPPKLSTIPQLNR